MRKKVCHYLDMPIQHASDAILKRMGRRTTKAQLKRNRFPSSKRDSGYCSANHADRRLPGRDTGAA